MSAPVFSDYARDARANAGARTLDGGSLRLLAWDGVEVLAVVRFASPAFEPAAGGVALAHPMEPVPGLADGTPERWQCWTADGRLVVAGLVGPGQPLQIDGDVEQDGEVWIERFTYEVPR